jgi:hypothetical protein
VFISMRVLAPAAGAGGGAQLVDRVAVRTAASAAARRGLLLGVGPGNVHHDFELEQ